MCAHKLKMMPGLSDDELAEWMRVTPAELLETKSAFLAKRFIDKTWYLRNWEKRQNGVTPSTERVRRFRNKNRNVSETLPKQDEDVSATRAPTRSREERREEENREEKTREERPPTPNPLGLSQSEYRAVLELADRRWGASNGGPVVAEFLNEYEPRWVKAACDAAFDKFGPEFKPAYIRGTLQGYLRDGPSAAAMDRTTKNGPYSQGLPGKKSTDGVFVETVETRAEAKRVAEETRKSYEEFTRKENELKRQRAEGSGGEKS
jgi:hypothetical protein